jgi:hypothetical protein
MNKRELVAGLQAENQQWETLLGQISTAQMDEPTVAVDWSVKDIVAHITTWRQRTVDRLQAAADGTQPPPPPWPAHLASDEEINAWIYARHHLRSVEAVLEDARRIFAQLIAAVEALPDHAFTEPNHFPWLEGEPLGTETFFAHFHEEHEPDLRAWLAQQRTTRM